ncbi:MAG: ATP-binding cassette domain-containing protein [Nitrospiraceae bacterium]|nr:ATP-binding cassette domain-containing protein [Nitrospiraceae bacterium]
MKNMIEVKELTKHYNGLTAVDHINFDVEEGEVFGFLGPNGAGKTTTVRMLTGVIKPSSGSVSVMGFDIGRHPIRAKEAIGVVPDISNAYTELSAWNNLQFMAELYGVPKRVAVPRAEELLTRFDLYNRKDHKVKTFSKGMKQKLVAAMSLMNDPAILFLDEPTSGLDVHSARLIKGMVQELRKAGKTIFITTHYMDEASQLCNRVAIINHGRIAAIDAPEKLKVRIGGLQYVEVSFTAPVDVSDLCAISGIARVRTSGDKMQLYTDETDRAIRGLVDYSRSSDLEIVTLNTLTPTLEDVFVKLTEGV